MCVLLIIFSLLTVITFLAFVLAQKKFSYWKKKNVPYVKPLPIFGNYRKYILLQEYLGQTVQKLCQQFPKAPYFGAFYGTEPVLIVQSPDVLKQIYTKDFYYFYGREITNYEDKEIITRNLFFTSGDRWKIVRHNLSPLFSSAKMKNMFHLIEKYCHIFEDTLDRVFKHSNVIEARQLISCYTMDCICSCAFGIESNTMTNPENNPFKFMADEIFRATTFRGFKLVVRAIWPTIFYGLGFIAFPDTIATFFSKMLKDVFESRDYKPSPRNDFVDSLLSLKKHDAITSDSIRNIKTGLDEKVYLKIDDDLLVAQCILFFAAGYETSATTMSFILFELAKNPDVQKRAAAQVDGYLRRHNKKLNYECVNELPYLEACLYETLRLYPVLGNVTREVMDDVTLSDGLRLDKGLRIHIPVYALNHNPDYYPEPEQFKPERFLPENKNNIDQYTFFPYGEGPRNCMGKRFSKMQILPGLVTFLKKYRVELADGMPETLTLESRSFLIQPKEQGLYLKVVEREGWEQRKLVRT